VQFWTNRVATPFLKADARREGSIASLEHRIERMNATWN
jgi:hypothetical protein